MIKKTKKQLAFATKNLKKVFFFFCLLATLPVFGQGTVEALKSAPATVPTTPSTFTKNVSIGLNVGVTNGVGIDVAYRFAKHWAGKLAYNYADYSVKGYNFSYTTTATDGTKTTQAFGIDAGINLSNLGLTVEYSPRLKGRFKIVGGLSYYLTNTMTGGGQLLSALKINDVILNSDDLGSGSILVSNKQKVAPYLGLSFGRTFPRKRLNVSFDMGAHYKSDYTVAINVKPGIILKENEY